MLVSRGIVLAKTTPIPDTSQGVSVPYRSTIACDNPAHLHWTGTPQRLIMPDLPSGTVTFLFTDIEGSTALWERDRVAMHTAVDRHLVLLDAATASPVLHPYSAGGAYVNMMMEEGQDRVRASYGEHYDRLAADQGEIRSGQPVPGEPKHQTGVGHPASTSGDGLGRLQSVFRYADSVARRIDGLDNAADTVPDASIVSGLPLGQLRTSGTHSSSHAEEDL